MSMLRRVSRLIRMFFVTLVYTARQAWRLRRMPEAERARYQALRQTNGCRKLCRILNVHVTCTGTVPRDEAMLIVCNHIGMLDPFALATQMPVAFVAKAEMASWPFAGWVCRVMGILFVDRNRRTRTNDFVARVRRRMADGVHVLVFPEGTTNGEPELLPFKTGAFEAVAGLDEAHVLPCYLHVVAVNGRPADDPAVRNHVVWAGGSQSFGEHAWHLLGLERVDLEVRVGTPVPVAGRSRKELAQDLHARVTALASPPAVITPSAGRADAS
ncbi:MAG: 1-acyl-sn-glycerol-3-phosphate acyltransferase [Bacteroidetes bacterium]|nr:MAG: 1-acyl-sn-glycerol-3-phosphate acyltransferase [Bacteroidota bacterium]